MECDNLSARSFLDNNDLNITACCFQVNVEAEQIFTIHASPCFWQLIFQKVADRNIKSANTINASTYGATTCVRMAYKAFQMGLPFSFGTINPTGSIATSHKKKLDIARPLCRCSVS